MHIDIYTYTSTYNKLTWTHKCKIIQTHKIYRHKHMHTECTSKHIETNIQVVTKTTNTDACKTSPHMHTRYVHMSTYTHQVHTSIQHMQCACLYMNTYKCIGTPAHRHGWTHKHRCTNTQKTYKHPDTYTHKMHVDKNAHPNRSHRNTHRHTSTNVQAQRLHILAQVYTNTWIHAEMRTHKH